MKANKNQKSKPFIHDDFLLNSDPSHQLYHDIAEHLPIIDYHNHLSPEDLAEDRYFENLTELWIANDPYKHRAMRLAGVPERIITGAEASDRERFDAWAETLPKTLGNPLFHWSALELKRIFGIDDLLSPTSADDIWERTQSCLQDVGYSARPLLARTPVETMCTSDGLDDSLTSHENLVHSDFSAQVLPSLRDPDRVDAERLGAFEALGCRIADHAVSDASGLDGLRLLAAEYKCLGWTLLLHVGALRLTSSRLRECAGPKGGYAAMGNSIDIQALSQFLNTLEADGSLPNTVLFPLNPVDFPALATLTGSFCEDGTPGKLQLGPAWWYNDHALGIRQHLEALSNYGLLFTFVGMTTDSRSLLSMSRHEYFRRVLCDFLGEKIVRGEIPDDDELLRSLITQVCYHNAKTMLEGSTPDV